jgi:hypothetical protein
MTFAHHIFVDFENVREADLDLLDGHSAALTLVLGKQQKSLPLGLVEALRRLPPEQVKLVQSQVQGRNSLDFVLACLVGRAVERQPGLAVHIVSKDKGFDALIAHLQERGVPASRHDSLTGVPVLREKSGRVGGGSQKTAPAAAGKPPAAKAPPALKAVPSLDDRIARIAERLAKNKSNRPKKKATLLSHIQGQFGGRLRPDEVEATFNGLVDRGAVTVEPTGHVGYLE